MDKSNTEGKFKTQIGCSAHLVLWFLNDIRDDGVQSN